jgi:hypothetical protein
MMNRALSLFALLAASTAGTACVAQVFDEIPADEIGTVASELTGVEPDEIDCETAYYVGSANGGVWKTTDGSGQASAGNGVYKSTDSGRWGRAHSGDRGEIDCETAAASGNTYYVGSANGGVWKTSNGAARAEEADGGDVGFDDGYDRGELDSDEEDDTGAAGTGGSSARGVTYGPVITIKPKG